MEKSKLLLRHIENNDLLKAIIVNKAFSEINLSHVDFIKEWDEQYLFKNLSIGESLFSAVRVMITFDNIFISLLTDNLSFFDDPLTHFGVEGLIYEKDPYEINANHIKEFRRKIGTIMLFNKSGNLSVLKSEIYGCIIKIRILI